MKLSVDGIFGMYRLTETDFDLVSDGFLGCSFKERTIREVFLERRVPSVNMVQYYFFVG